MMCDQHLLGEHLEMHMFAGVLRKGGSLAGYIRKGLVELPYLRTRHEVLATEMTNRGMHHKSPLDTRGLDLVGGNVDPFQNVLVLCGRCRRCNARLNEIWKRTVGTV